MSLLLTLNTVLVTEITIGDRLKKRCRYKRCQYKKTVRKILVIEKQSYGQSGIDKLLDHGRQKY